jgi:uncharacterized protein YcnI
VLLLAAPASAHVSVDPSEASKEPLKVSFRVPNEKEDANTTSVEVNMPEDAPIANVSVKPVPGWTANIETRTLEEPIQGDDGESSEVVDKVTWSGGNDRPGRIPGLRRLARAASRGPRPGRVRIQTYDDGDAVRWIEEPGANGEEPEHPVPTPPHGRGGRRRGRERSRGAHLVRLGRRRQQQHARHRRDWSSVVSV